MSKTLQNVLRESSKLSQISSIKKQKKVNFSPVVWRRFGVGYRIEDLKEKDFEEAINILKESFLPSDYLTKTFKIHLDDTSKDSFLNRALFHMQSNNSLIIIDERLKSNLNNSNDDNNKEEIAGVLILRIMNKLDYGLSISRVNLINDQEHKKLINFKNQLFTNNDIFDKMKCDNYLNCYYLCIKPKFRRKEFGLKLMKAALDMARAVKVPVIAGIFNTRKLQILANKIGMNVLSEINYAEWNNNEESFLNKLEINCSLMAGFVPEEPLPEPENLKIVEQVETKKKGKDKKGKDKKKKK